MGLSQLCHSLLLSFAISALPCITPGIENSRGLDYTPWQHHHPSDLTTPHGNIITLPPASLHSSQQQAHVLIALDSPCGSGGSSGTPPACPSAPLSKRQSQKAEMMTHGNSMMIGVCLTVGCRLFWWSKRPDPTSTLCLDQGPVLSLSPLAL